VAETAALHSPSTEPRTRVVFNSFIFVIFHVVVFILHWALPVRHRWPLLLLASYFFYMYWNVAYAGILVASTLIDFLLGRTLLASGQEPRRRLGLWLSIISNLGILFFFKYYNFFQDSLVMLGASVGITVTPARHAWLLPVGISFYTFQTLSYSVDVYRRQLAPERHLGRFALYVSFFPQLVAGPIERASALLPQLQAPLARPSHLALMRGMSQVLLGFFKKVVVADTLAIQVDSIYNNHEMQSGPALVLATVLFAFQIYCDFSGYTDIAIGVARMLGYDLMENFRLPYFSKSVTEFWQRWHISLGTWLRDYLYIPLGGNRHGAWNTYRNLMLTMLLGGLWHGASWNFVIWGGLNGGALALERALRNGWITTIAGGWMKRLLGVAYTFVFICITWVFFRSQTLEQAWSILGRMSTFSGALSIQDRSVLANILIVLPLLLAFEFLLQRRMDVHKRFAQGPLLMQLTVTVTIVLLIALFGVSAGSQFIYFQF
jgi:D-alanyl-lipoteichoic acid acyltransferase DltB (MBOAT superfamily)